MRFILPAAMLLSVLLAGTGILTAAENGPNTITEQKYAKNIEKRSDYHNSRAVFERSGHGQVAFLGGSITEMKGYRLMVADFLKKRFPKTEFTFIYAGISSTCSTAGAFRLEQDVLSAGPVDLLFVEFAVNDNQDGFFDETTALRGMEGIIRRLRLSNPAADIVMTFFVNEPIMADYRAGKEAVSIIAHQRVAEYYGVSCVNLAREVTHRIDSGQLIWEEFGGVHPAERGNRLCTEMIETLLEACWAGPIQDATPEALPEPLDRFSYFNADFCSPEAAQTDSGWRYLRPDWENIPGQVRERFNAEKLLCAEKPNAAGSIKFSGSVAAAYLLAGPDAGKLEFSIDGGEKQTADLYHPFSAGLHYPRTVIFADELADGDHTLSFTVSEEKNEKSTGTAVRILNFTDAP